MAELPPYCNGCNEDGRCDARESCNTCPQDCGSCAAESWQQQASPTNRTLHALGGSGPDDVWAVGQDGVVLHYSGGGWQLVQSPATEDLFDLWVAGPGELWVAGAGGTVLQRKTESWTKAHALADLVSISGEAPVYTSIAGVTADDLWVLPQNSIRTEGNGAMDLALHFDGAGWTYARRPACYACTSYRLAAAASDEVWIVRSLASPQRWDGQGWTDVPLPAAEERIFWGRWLGTAGLWLVGERSADSRGEIVRWDGIGWREHSESLAADYRCRGVWGQGNELWLACLGGAILRYDGADWTVERPAGQRAGLLAIWGSSAADLWAVGMDGTILRRVP